MSTALTIKEINFYRENGYLLLNNFFDAQRMTAALAAINDILSIEKITTVAELEPRDPAIVRRIWGTTFKHPFYAAMAEDEKLLDAIACLIGDNIIFHYSKINMKAPHIGSPVEWHQDFSYYPHTNTDLLSCLIYLDDADPENGCLQVIPGSHKSKLYSHEINGYFRGKVALENLPPNFNSIHLAATAGSVILLHCLTLHASTENKSNKPRRVFLPAYRAADAYPIHLGKYTADHEITTKIIRGQIAKQARLEAGCWALPFPEKEFNSLYELQEGSHLQKARTKGGYYGHTLDK
jgi:hypothetical protein